ncbi:hypothetical protein POG22_00240, partial [Geitlerinema sp. CS-897]|nr:hypothetical protein [Geitlerinema sp. CS-897]
MGLVIATAMSVRADSFDSIPFAPKTTHRLSQSFQQRQEIVGTVRSIRDHDEFILETDRGTVRVDADLRDSQALDLTPGERVTVTG